MDTVYDVVIIGGGPGGSSFATYVKQLGLSAIVLEREKFPRDHVGESLIPLLYWNLKELGVLEKVKAHSSLKPGVNFTDYTDSKSAMWHFNKVLTDESHMSFHTVRSIFDKTLLDNSAAHGAIVKEEHTVMEVELENETGGVTVTVMDANDNLFDIQGRFLIDASGQSSFLAKKLKTKVAYKDLDRVAFFTHWVKTNYDAALSQGFIKIIYLEGEKKGWIWVIPVGRNHLSIGVSLNNSYIKAHYSKLTPEEKKGNWKEKFYLSQINEAGALKKILDGAEQEHIVVSIGDYSYYSEQKFGKNYALIGDASAFLDPIFSSGIYVAMESAKRISKAVHIQLTHGFEQGQEALENEFKNIDGTYKLIEKFVRLFYNPELLNFSHTDANDKDSYERFLRAYNVFHYLLAGDFFDNSKKYIEFIDTLTSEKSYNRFIEYIQKNQSKRVPIHQQVYTYNDIYGHLAEKDKVVSVNIQ